MWEESSCHLQWIPRFEIKRVVCFPCPQISGSQVWLHIYLMSLTLSPRNSDWMVLRAARVLLCSLSWALQLWPTEATQGLMSSPWLKGLIRQTWSFLHWTALSEKQCTLSSEPCRVGKTGYLSSFYRWRHWIFKRNAKGQTHTKSEADRDSTQSL